MGKSDQPEPDHNKLDQEHLLGRRSASGTICSTAVAAPPTNTTHMTNSASALPFHSESSLKRYAEWISILDGFQSIGSDVLLETLRSIRNKIIGHAEVKKLLIQQGFIPRYIIIIITGKHSYPDRLVQILRLSESDKTVLACKRECSVMIGSIVTDGPVSDEVVPVLMGLLVSLDTESASDEAKALVESTLRALRTVFRHAESPRDIPFQVRTLMVPVNFIV